MVECLQHLRQGRIPSLVQIVGELGSGWHPLPYRPAVSMRLYIVRAVLGLSISAEMCTCSGWYGLPALPAVDLVSTDVVSSVCHFWYSFQIKVMPLRARDIAT